MARTPNATLFSAAPRFAKKGIPGAGMIRWVAAVAATAGMGSLHAQESFNPGMPLSIQSGFGNTFGNARGNPYDDFSTLQAVPYLPNGGRVNRTDYNFKLGNVTASLAAGLQTTFSDNVVYSPTDPEMDFAIEPFVRLTSQWALTKYNELTLDLGVGYRQYINHSELSSLTAAVTPNSVLAYRILVGDVLVVFYDRMTAPNDSRLRSESIGGTTGLVNYQRIQNTTGTTAAWAPTEDLSLTAGYGYTLDRGLTGSFGLLDRNIHGFNTATQQRLGPRWAAGLYGSYSIVEYATSEQNNATAWSIGPLINYQLTRYITLTAAFGYSVTSFENNAVLAAFSDTSNFAGLTFEFVASHQATRYFQHALSLARGSQLGFGSNFSENTSVTYRASFSGIKRLGLSMGLSYVITDLSSRSAISGVTSGTDLRSTIGASYPLSRHADVGVYYASTIANRDRLITTGNPPVTRLGNVDITENSVVATLNYRF